MNRQREEKISVEQLSNLHADGDDTHDVSEIGRRAYVMQNSVEYSELLTFLNDSTDRITGPKDDRTHIYNREGGWWQLQNSEEQHEVFNLYEKCRQAKCYMTLCERQDPVASGIFIDLDMFQDRPHQLWTDLDLNNFNASIVKVLMEMFDLPAYMRGDRILIMYQKKPQIQIKTSAEAQTYKKSPDQIIYGDGLHIFVLNVMISRPAKRYFMEKLQNEATPIFANYLNAAKIVDQHSPNVAVALYGSTRPGKPNPYEFHSMWTVRCPNDKHDAIQCVRADRFFRDGCQACGIRPSIKTSKKVSAGDDLLSSSSELFTGNAFVDYLPINPSHEFSLNFERRSDMYGLIKKIRITAVRPELEEIISQHDRMSKIRELQKGKKADVHNAQVMIDLERLITSDQRAKIVFQLTEIMEDVRAENYMLWCAVVWAIANISAAYRPIAEVFSMRSEKYSPAEFEKFWEDAVERAEHSPNTGYNMINIKSWAAKDNEQKCAAILSKSLDHLILEQTYHPNCGGRFTNSDIANLLYAALGERYARDFGPNGSKQIITYEFVNPNEGMTGCVGQAFKWREDTGSSYLHEFISRNLVPHFNSIANQVRTRIPKQKDDDDDDGKKAGALAKWHSRIVGSLVKTIQNLGSDSFKSGCINQFKHLIQARTTGFTESLNKDPNLLGVGNGVVYLKEDGTHLFINGPHTHRISQYTKTCYVEFDPTDLITKRLLMMMRNVFPDDQPDTHNWIMCFCASALDGHIKEGLFVLGHGGGANAKSTLSELMSNTLGDTYAVALPVGSLTQKTTGSQANPDLIMLTDARWTVFSESSQMEKVNMALIKRLTGQERMAIRGLFKDMVNVMLHTVFILFTNHLIEINDTSYAAFRRLVIVKFMMQFCVDPRDYDPTNPYHRLADKDFNKTFIRDPKVCSRWLSILLWYYRLFRSTYKGSLNNVPHPHIVAMTEEFRATQDKLNLFIHNRAVFTTTKVMQLQTDVINMYLQWYKSEVDRDCDEPKIRQNVEANLSNSAVSKFLTKNAKNQPGFVGLRFLKPGEPLKLHEIAFADKHKIVIAGDNKQDLVTPAPLEPEKKHSGDTSESESSDDDISDSDKPKVKIQTDKEDDHEDDEECEDRYKANLVQAKKEMTVIVPENADQYYSRIVKEWTEWKESQNITHPDESKDLLDYDTGRPKSRKSATEVQQMIADLHTTYRKVVPDSKAAQETGFTRYQITGLDAFESSAGSGSDSDNSTNSDTGSRHSGGGSVGSRTSKTSKHSKSSKSGTRKKKPIKAESRKKREQEIEKEFLRSADAAMQNEDSD